MKCVLMRSKVGGKCISILCRSLARNLKIPFLSSANSARPRISAIESINAGFSVVVGSAISRHGIEERCSGLSVH